MLEGTVALNVIHLTGAEGHDRIFFLNDMNRRRRRIHVLSLMLTSDSWTLHSFHFQVFVLFVDDMAVIFR